MPFQVLARKWRPQQFDDVVGQPAVTRTLANAIKLGRIAQSFVFAGPRGVGKTTTARILARALSCEKGPTPNPCGVCDACREIAEGRDIDVLEIDAATHTQVDNVREVIISGLSILPARNRYKVFIIDEVHQLSNHSFNALLKSIEEPPPHVVFMMATTELDKIPETVCRARRSSSSRPSRAARLPISFARSRPLRRSTPTSRRCCSSPARPKAACAMRRARSIRSSRSPARRSRPNDAATVLGLVGRDLVLDMVAAVADETPAAAFELAGKAVELGYDLRIGPARARRVPFAICMVLAVDPSRIDDPEIAAEGERDRMKTLSRRFSREDLLRSFDVLAKAESDMREHVAASLSPRDGAAAMDPHAQAGAAHRAARRTEW